MGTLPHNLPPDQEIAIAYALPGDRPAVRALLELDRRLSEVVATGGEPLVSQLRLAWWRDVLGKRPEDRPAGEPLIELLGQSWGARSCTLVALVDGWEALLAEKLDAGAIDNFVAGRTTAWAEFPGDASERVGEGAVERAAKLWALADLLAHLATQADRQLVLEMAAIQGKPPSLPRRMRPLSILAGLGRRALRRGGRPLMEGRGAALKALRIGMFGR